MRTAQQGRRGGVRVALVEQYAMVAESFVVAMRPVCAPCPVLVRPGAAAAAIASSALAARPDVAVLHLDAFADRELPIEQLAAAGVVTTVLTDRRGDARLGEFIERGAEAALSTELGLRQLVNVIDRVAARQSAMEPAEMDRLRAAARASGVRTGDPMVDAVSLLSIREGEVLRQLMSGSAPAQIARQGFVSEATVRTQVRSILAKLGVGSQLAAVAIAYRAGWQPASTEALTGLSRAAV